MRGSVVENPEHAPGVAVWGLGHHLGDQSLKRLDARRELTPTEQLGAVHIQRGEIGPGASPRVLVFNPDGLARPRRRRGVDADAGLNARFLVGRDDKLIRPERAALVSPGIEIENAAGFHGKIGIAREDPGAMLPGPDGILVEPTPHGLVANRGDNATALRLAYDVGGAQVGEWQPVSRRQLTGERLDLDDDLWGEKPGDDPGGGAPRVQPSVQRRSACARD